MAKPRRKARAVRRRRSPSLRTSPERFINRELSWLAFNTRVLEEAENPSHPLLERLRFLSISANNLDEFYMVRVAGLHEQVKAGASHAEPRRPDAGRAAQRSACRRRRADGRQQERWRALRGELRDAGIAVLEPEELDRRRARLAAAALHGGSVSAADAARGRSGASVSVHPEPGLRDRAEAEAPRGWARAQCAASRCRARSRALSM